MRVAQARTIDPPTRMDPEVLEAAGVTRVPGFVEDMRELAVEASAAAEAEGDEEMARWFARQAKESVDQQSYLAARGQVER